MRRNILKIILSLLVCHPALLLGAAAVAGLLYAYEVIVARPAMIYMGIPKEGASVLGNRTRILRNEAYMTGYSDLLGNPLWVVYRLHPLPKAAPFFKRPKSFRIDWRNLTFITPSDYTQSGYDRGHLAPSYAISRLYGRNAQEETFLMTNITPQRPNLNQKAWQRLEQLELDRFASEYETLWVVAGPVFNAKRERLKNSFFVEIPDAFYKIYVGEKVGNEPNMWAYLIPRNVKGAEKLEKFRTPVDVIESMTGFDFFSGLPDEIEERLERKR